MLGYTAKMYAFQEERILMMKIALPYKEERSTWNTDLVIKTLELGDLWNMDPVQNWSTFLSDK